MRVELAVSLVGTALGAQIAATDSFNYRDWAGHGNTPTCYLPLDVVFLQDTTESFTDDLPNVVEQIPAMIAAIQTQHPGSYFAVAEFKDKPILNFGWPEADYCYRLADPLAAEEQKVLDGYSVLYASGGNDLPEDSYGAIMTTFQYNQVGWRPMGVGAGEARVRLVIISTDAIPHWNTDPSAGTLSYLPANDGQCTQNNITHDCIGEQYPSPDQVYAAVKAMPDQYVAILTPADDPNVVDTWNWINKDLLQQPDAFYQLISKDSSNFVNGVMAALEAVTAYACPTTPAPTSPETSPESTPVSTHSHLPPPTTEDTTTEESTTTTTTPEVVTTTEVVTTNTETRMPCPCPCPREPCECHCEPEIPCDKKVAVKIVGESPHDVLLKLNYADGAVSTYKANLRKRV